MSPADRPRLAKKARLRFDRVEKKKVLLSPERGLVLNGGAARIVELCDGVRTVASIVDALAAGGAARPEVERDVMSFLDELAARGLLEAGDG